MIGCASHFITTQLNLTTTTTTATQSQEHQNCHEHNVGKNCRSSPFQLDDFSENSTNLSDNRCRAIVLRYISNKENEKGTPFELQQPSLITRNNFKWRRFEFQNACVRDTKLVQLYFGCFKICIKHKRYSLQMLYYPEFRV